MPSLSAMNIRATVKDNPMTWKDWVSTVGLALTMGTVVLQGGRMIERQEFGNRQLVELTGQVQQLRNEVAAAQRDLVAQRGVDSVHDEQIRGLRRDLDGLSTLTRGRR